MLAKCGLFHFKSEIEKYQECTLCTMVHVDIQNARL